MTLACGNTSSVVEKLSTNCDCAQSLVGLFILISIVGVATVDGDPRRAGVQPRAESTLSPHFQLKDAA